MTIIYLLFVVIWNTHVIQADIILTSLFVHEFKDARHIL